jgi:indole-3-glycerol phosphate synthase
LPACDGDAPIGEPAMILNEIIENKRIEVERRKAEVAEAQLRKMLEKRTEFADFQAAISADKGRLKLICEMKKASPSAGMLKEDFDPVEIAQAYERGGADALSVLTEEKYFLGSLEHIVAIRNAGMTLPILRKDFTCDLYQVLEAAAFGADAVLLIVGVMRRADAKAALHACGGYGLTAVVEVHTEDQLKEAVDIGAEIIQINNRDLRSLKVDPGTTERLVPLIPRGTTVIGASGVKGSGDIKRLREMGVDAALVGETLMRHPDPAALVAELVAAAC